MSFALDRETIEAADALPPERTRLLTLLLYIWVRPRRALEQVAAGPRWLWLIPLVCAVAALLLRAFVAAPLQAEAQTALMQAQIQAQAQAFPAAEGEMVVEVPPTPSSTAVAPALVGGLGVILLGWALRALILQVGSLAVGGRQSFGQVYRLSAWAAFPLILRDVVQAVYMLISGELVTGPGLSGLVSQSGPGVANGLLGLGGQALSLPGVVLGRIDIYTLWFLALLVVAIQVGGTLKLGKAILVTGIYATLALLPGLLVAVVGGTLAGF